MPVRTLDDTPDLQGKRVLVRADFNVALNEGRIEDDTRIKKTLPTIETLKSRGAIVILCSHLGRPDGSVKEELRLDPVASRLEELLGSRVHKLDDCVGEEVKAAVEEREAGDVVLLENTRFHTGETRNEEEFSRQLAELAEIYVHDAFGAAHRAHASTEGVGHHLPAFAGQLMSREIEALEEVRDSPRHPFVVLLGGAKVSGKIGVIERFLEVADTILVGGAMANTFLAAGGVEVEESLVDEDSLSEATRLAERAGDKLVLPVDAVVAAEPDPDAERKIASVNAVPRGWHILDVGPETVTSFEKKVAEARTVLWNGPLGAFEWEPFAEGTFSMARALARSDATTIVGGGETVAAITQLGLEERFTHVSTGGGAFLEFMEGKELPGIRILKKNGRSG
ncbi:MAG: phosphoglycerate kinase [Gemmatimonadales bacterium]|nr:MAG: phosphoglycerate kinase [Gemmatimonadales bacterium]